MSLIWKVVHFFCGHCKICCIFLPFLFLVAIARYVAFKLLGTIAFFLYHCKICCILDFGRLLLHAASKLHYLIKLINLLFHSVFFMAKSLIKLRALHGEKSVLRIMSIKALSLICLTLQLSGSLYPLPKTDPLSVLATQHLCMKSSQASS